MYFCVLKEHNLLEWVVPVHGPLTLDGAYTHLEGLQTSELGLPYRMGWEKR